MPRASDASFIEQAVTLARKGEGHTRPNPAVGAVIVRDGAVIGRGWHRRAGGDHAEVAAIKDALRRGGETRGATIYVTLEPCSKPGRVGACTEAIAAAGLARVVYGATDPNPANRGRAKRVLARKGIRCDFQPSAACAELIRPFAKHVTTGLPYVTVKLALSLDGRICDDAGKARWVSSPSARKLTGELRAHVDAILVGAETVRRDDPSLLSHGRRNDDLIRVVVTKSGRLPKSAQVFTDGAVNPTWVYRIGRDVADLRGLMADLGRLGVMHVLCEGGLKLATSLAEAGLVDEWLTVLAPCVIAHRSIDQKLPFALQDINLRRTAAGDSLLRFTRAW